MTTFCKQCVQAKDKMFLILWVLVSLFAITPMISGEIKAENDIEKMTIIQLQREKDVEHEYYQSRSFPESYRATGNCVVVDTITAPDGGTQGLAWDKGNLWASEGGSAGTYPGVIFKIDTAGNILSSFDAPGQSSQGPHPQGLAFDGTYLWSVDFLDGKIYKLSKSGAVIGSIPAPSGIASGLAWDGANLWVSEWYTYKIYKLNPENGQILMSFNAPDFEEKPPYGLAWDGSYLWASNSNGIYKLDPATGAVLASCNDSAFEYGKAYAMTWDGQYLWGGSWISNSIIKIGVSPFVDVKANGQDDPLIIDPNTPVSITVSLNPGGYASQNADWWVAESTPSGTFNYYDLSTGSMVPGLLPTHQGPLFNLGTTQLLNSSDLMVGAHTFYFGVDLNMNGLLDMNSIYYDSVVVNVTTLPTAAITDTSGQVTLKIADQNIQFQFLDEITRSPIQGLTVGVGSDAEADGLVPMLIIDPTGQYPLQAAILHGKTATTGNYSQTLSNNSVVNKASDSTKVFTLTKDLVSLIQAVGLLDTLPKVKMLADGFDVVDSVANVATLMNALGLPMGELAGVYGKTETLTRKAVRDKLWRDWNTAQMKRGFFFSLSGLTGKPLLPNLVKTWAGAMIDTSLLALNETTVTNCNDNVVVTTLGPYSFFVCEKPVDTKGFVFPKNPNLDINVSPISGGYLELINKKILGESFVAVLDPQGQAEIPVPIGDYTTRAASPGFNSTTTDISVPEEGTSLNVTLQPAEAHLGVFKAGRGSGTVTSNPGKINCDANDTKCSDTYAIDTLVTLTAKADPDSTFAHWSGAYSGNEESFVLIMDADKAVTAIFDSDDDGDNPFQGSLSGSWKGECNYYGDQNQDVKGWFSVTIDAIGEVEGSFDGNDSGPISGSVTDAGSFSATAGSAGEYSWRGQLTGSGSSLSGNGEWDGTPEGISCSGSWSAP